MRVGALGTRLDRHWKSRRACFYGPYQFIQYCACYEPGTGLTRWIHTISLPHGALATGESRSTDRGFGPLWDASSPTYLDQTTIVPSSVSRMATLPSLAG